MYANGFKLLTKHWLIQNRFMQQIRVPLSELNVSLALRKHIINSLLRHAVRHVGFHVHLIMNISFICTKAARIVVHWLVPIARATSHCSAIQKAVSILSTIVIHVSYSSASNCCGLFRVSGVFHHHSPHLCSATYPMILYRNRSSACNYTFDLFIDSL